MMQCSLEYWHPYCGRKACLYSQKKWRWMWHTTTQTLHLLHENIKLYGYEYSQDVSAHLVQAICRQGIDFGSEEVKMMEIGLFWICNKGKKLGSYSIWITVLRPYSDGCHEEIKIRTNSGNACYYSVQIVLSSRFQFKWNLVLHSDRETNFEGVWK